MNEGKVQVLKNGVWTDVFFTEVKTGDHFRIFDEKGEIVGKPEYEAASDYYLKDGEGTVDIKWEEVK